MFYEEGKTLFAGAQAYTHSVLVSNTDCKHNFCLFTRNLHRAALNYSDLNEPSQLSHQNVEDLIQNVDGLKQQAVLSEV